MKIGVPKEIKNNEFRVGLKPQDVAAYVKHGHSVVIENDAGLGAGFSNEAYQTAGATLEPNAAKIWADAEMIIKVKEPIKSEYPHFKEGLLLYTYLHLADNEPLTKELLAKKVTSVAYETITDNHGALPCLTPMSEIAGRLSVQMGAYHMQRNNGGAGVLLGGVPGVARANVIIVGAGVVGINALKIAVGMQANVTILDINTNRLAYLDDIYATKITTLFSSEENIRSVLPTADLIVGAVLIPGAKAPHLIRKEHLKLLKPRTVLVDVAIDQGGCFETSHATTHQDPVYDVDNIIHYCVANMPGAVAQTSTRALTDSTLCHGLALANKGLLVAVKYDKHLYNGVNTHAGKCTYQGVAEAWNLPFEPLAV